MSEPLDPPAGEPSTQPSLVPFAAALAVVVVVGVLAALFLRSEDGGELVRPDRIDVTGDDTVRAVVSELAPCRRIERAQADFDDERVLLELVAEEVDGCTDGDARTDVVAEVTLSQPVDGREVVPGVGRTRLPCTDSGAVTCGPER